MMKNSWADFGICFVCQFDGYESLDNLQ